MSRFRKPKHEQMNDLRERFRREGVLRVKETTPKHGGVRTRDVEELVLEGLVEWIVPGRVAQLKGGKTNVDYA